MATKKAKTKKAKTKTSAKAMTKSSAKPKAKGKAKPAARPKAAKWPVLAAHPMKDGVGKRRAKTAADVKLRITEPVRSTPAQRPMSLMREMPLLKVKH